MYSARKMSEGGCLVRRMIWAPRAASSWTTEAPMPDVPPCRLSYQCIELGIVGEGTYSDHHHLGVHQPLGAVACSAEVVLQRGEQKDPWCYLEDRPGKRD